MAEGIEIRTGRDGTRSYRASVWSNRDGKRIRKTFARESEAKAWRQEAGVAVRSGAMRPPKPTTIRQAAVVWLAGARDGTIHNRSGDVYKPSAIRSYDQSLKLRVLPEFGAYRLSDLRRTDLQDFVDQLGAQGLSPSTVQCSLLPLRAIYRRAIARGDVAVNPCAGLELPAVRGRRDRIASPGEAAALIAALPPRIAPCGPQRSTRACAAEN